MSPAVSKSMGSIVDIAHVEPTLESEARVAVSLAVVQSPAARARQTATWSVACTRLCQEAVCERRTAQF